MKRIVEHVDVLVGNEEDFAAGPRHPWASDRDPGLDPSTFLGMIRRWFLVIPKGQGGCNERSVRSISTTRHDWSAAAWVNGRRTSRPTMELDVYDPGGGGDGFAAGFFYGLLTGAEPDEALRTGLGPRRSRRDLSGRYDHGNTRSGSGIGAGWLSNGSSGSNGLCLPRARDEFSQARRAASNPRGLRPSVARLLAGSSWNSRHGWRLMSSRRSTRPT